MKKIIMLILFVMFMSCGTNTIISPKTNQNEQDTVEVEESYSRFKNVTIIDEFVVSNIYNDSVLTYYDNTCSYDFSIISNIIFDVPEITKDTTSRYFKLEFTCSESYDLRLWITGNSEYYSESRSTEITSIDFETTITEYDTSQNGEIVSIDVIYKYTKYTVNCPVIHANIATGDFGSNLVPVYFDVVRYHIINNDDIISLLMFNQKEEIK